MGCLAQEQQCQIVILWTNILILRTVAMHYEDRLQLTSRPRGGCHDVEDQSVNAMVLSDPIDPPPL